MDPHNHQHNQQQEDNGSANNGSSCVGGVGSGSKVGFLCRQSSTRWIPTSDQIRILRDLYYNNGIRSPSNEQIQRISARLRQYGKIEGKNVFYWFQNHKARERQKKRLTVDVPNSNAAASSNFCNGNTKCNNNSSSNTSVMSPGITTPCSSSGYYGVGQMGGSGYSNPIFTERKFRDYYCVPGAGDVPAGNEGTVGMLGFEAACETTPWTMHHYTSEHEAIATTREIETLPLFPVNTAAGGDEYKFQTPSKDGYNSMNYYLQMPFYSCGGQQQPEELYNHCNGSSTSAVSASLELSLKSYYYPPPGST